MRKIHTYFYVRVSPMISDQSIEDSIYNKIKEKFEPKLTDSTNVFHIKMEYFEKFISEFSESEHIDWQSISSSKYYDWNIECLRIGKNVLDWNKLMENKTTSNLIKSEEFPQELNDYLPDPDEMNYFEESDEDLKSVFVIKEYSGVLSEYFRLESVVEKEVKSNLPNIGKIKWLASYSTPFDIMNQEKLKFDLSEFDYILAFDIDTDKDGTNSKIAKEMAVEQNLKISYTLKELIENASC